MRVTVRRLIQADPGTVYDKVADLGRMPRRSPEAHAFECLTRGVSEVGAQFRGSNRLGFLHWWTYGWITVADRGQRFEFETSTIYRDRQERTNRWSYTFEAVSGGTMVTEQWHSLRLPIHLKLLGPFLAVRWLQLRHGMKVTLRSIAIEVDAPSTGD